MYPAGTLPEDLPAATVGATIGRPFLRSFGGLRASRPTGIALRDVGDAIPYELPENTKTVPDMVPGRFYCALIIVSTQYIVHRAKYVLSPHGGYKKMCRNVGISTIDNPTLNWYNIIDTLCLP